MLSTLVVGAIVAYALLCVAIFFARHRMIFPVRGGAMGNPATFGIPDAEAVTMPSEDGHGVAAWFLPAVPAAEPSGVLVWFHGNAETLAGLAPIFRAFRAPGVALLAVEYRGYGSPGTATVDNVERDALAAWAWLAQRAGVDTTRAVVYGRSIGSGPAIHLAARRPVAGLIVESGFSTMRKLAHFHFPVVPSALAGRGFNNVADIARVACPILLVHGDHDRVVPTAMGRALAAAAGPRGELWIIRDTGHNETYDHGGAEYVQRVRAFVARFAGAPPRATVR